MQDATGLLLKWNKGDEEARASLMQDVYSELRTIAAVQLAREHAVLELQPAALVNEAYLRLIDLKRIDWKNRAHFLAMAGRIMREILIDHARKRLASKRDGGIQVTMTGLAAKNSAQNTDALMLHDALESLAEHDPDRARLVELRYFGGLTIEETAEVMGMSPATVKRNWNVARGWLFRALQSKGN